MQVKEMNDLTLSIPEDSKLSKAETYSINEHMLFAYWTNEDMAFYFRQSPDELRVKLNTLASILFLEMPEFVSSDNIAEVVNHLRREAAKRMNKSIEELCLEWRARA